MCPDSEVLEIVESGGVHAENAAAETNDIQEGYSPEELAGIRKLAAKMGYKDPKELPEGVKAKNPEDFVLEERNISNKRLDETKHLKNEIESLHSDITEIKNHYQKMNKIELDKAREELNTDRRRAIEDGDIDKVDEVDEKLSEIGDAEKEETKQTGVSEGDKQVYTDWHNENDWYEKDVELSDTADVLAEKISKEHIEKHGVKIPVKTLFEELDDRIKPFRNRTNENKAGATDRTNTAASGVSNQSNLQGSKTKFTYADLSDAQKSFGENFVKHGLYKDIQEYVDELAEVGDIHK